MRAAALLALLALAAGCGAGAERGELEPVDHRYRAYFSPAPPADRAEMELRFEAREGWHIVPDAIAHLELAAPDGFALLRPVQQGEDALVHSEDTLAFGLALQRVASGAGPVDAAIQGSVKFGICRDDATGCEIVRRELALALPASGP